MYEELLKKLDEAGNIGLDLSPGDPLAREAAVAIRHLQEDVDNLWAEIDLMED